MKSNIISRFFRDLFKLGSDKPLSLTIYYDCIPDTPIGAICIGATDKGLFAINFDLTEDDFAKQITKRAEITIEDNTQKTGEITAQIKAYLVGELKEFNIPVDLRTQTDFQQKVLCAVKEIPYGVLNTYGDLAVKVEQPNAYRAVGQVLSRNPIPLVIPCHRVVSADGTLGGYGGVLGSERKIKLLKLEGAILA